MTSDSDRELQILTARIREETSSNSKESYRMGELLLKLGEFDKAEQLYSAVFQETSDNNEQADIFYQLGRVKNKQGDYEKALEIEQKILLSNHPDLATTCNNIAVIYEKMKEYSKSLSLYERTLDIKQRLLPPNHPNLQDVRESIKCVKKKL